MKTTMKTHRWMIGPVAAGAVLCLALPPRATAEVTDDAFNALKDAVQKLSEQVQSLQQTNVLQQQTHQKDVEQIQQLQEKLAETQQIATNAAQKSIEAAQAQPPLREPIDEATVNHNFMILGDAEFQYVKASGQHGAFLFADFMPIFLYRANDNILFEAGFDTMIQNGQDASKHDSGQTTSFALEFAQLDYVMNEYATFSAGDLLLPLGTYSIRSGGWLNKFPDGPLAVSLIPGSGVGAMLQGGIPVGDSGKLLNYQIYGVNGPSSSDGTGSSGMLDLGGNVGLKNNNTAANLHGGLTGGGRVGFFVPFKPHYDLEFGVSGQSGEWDDAGQHLYTAGVLDAALHLGASFEAKGEYIATRYGSDSGTINQQGWWAQAGYKLAGLNMELPVVNNVEVVGRYDSLHNAFDTGSFYNTRRWTAGLIYYITNTLLFEGDYEFVHSNDPAQLDQLILQLSYGF